MSTIKFVPMEFFAQFGLTQMRRLQARGAVGAAFPGAGRGWWAQVVVCTAFPARGAYCERWALSARLSGSGAGLAIVGSPFGGFHGSRSIVFRREALFADAEVPFARLFGVRGRRWWAQVAVCGRRSAVGAAFSGAGSPLVGAGRCLYGFPGAGFLL